MQIECSGIYRQLTEDNFFYLTYFSFQTHPIYFQGCRKDKEFQECSDSFQKRPRQESIGNVDRTLHS